ncbi:MAG: hypothetical protein ABL934_02195 [Lysobacteraceae bacterium]
MNTEDDEATESMHWTARWMLRWNGKPAVTRLYLAGLTFGIPAAIAWSIDPNRLATEVTIYVTFALLMVGLFHEIYVWTLPQIERPLVKLAIAALGLTVGAAATGLSRTIVGSATGQDPATFSTTVALLVPISFVHVIAALIACVGLLALVAIVIAAAIFLLTPKIVKKKIWTFNRPFALARFLALIGVVGSCYYLMQPSSIVYQSARWIAGISAYAFDLQPNPSCSPVIGDRIGRINDDVVVIGRETADGVQFVRKRCEIAAEATELRAPKSQRAESDRLPDRSP